MKTANGSRTDLWGRWTFKAAAGALAAAALAGSLAACGSISKLTTEDSVGHSLTSLRDQSSISLSFSIGLSPSQLLTLSKDVGGGLTAPEAQGLSRSSIFVDIASGHGEALNSKQFRTDSANKVDLGLEVGSTTPVEVRYVDQTLYARLQLTNVLTDFGQDASKAVHFQDNLEQANSFVPGLGALARGQWVSVSHASIESILGLLKQFEGSQGNTNQATIQAAIKKAESDIEAAFKRNASFANDGDHGGRTEYSVSVAARPFVQQAGTALQQDLNGLPEGSAISGALPKGLKEAEQKIPSGQKVTVQLWVKDNKAEEVDLDVRQFDPKLPFSVPVRLVIGTSPALNAPSGATSLDLSKLPQLIEGLFSGSQAT